ncbi:MAG: GAF domain-containing sensor histidine kinase [Acidimicrobiales bacterium]
MAFHRIYDPERLHALIDAILLIEADASLNELLSRIVETACRLVGSRYGALGVLTSDGESLARFITYGIDEETRERIGESPRGHGVLGETIRAASPLRIDELDGHPGASGFPANHPPMHAFLGVPVHVASGHIYGNLYLTEPLDGEVFSQEDQDLVEAFGRAAGIVIDQTLLRSQMREFTLSEERARMARDLHDTVIQRLFGVGLSMQMTLAATQSELVRERINKSLDELDETIHEIRTTIFEIDQDRPEGHSLDSRVRSMITEVNGRLGIPARLVIAPELDRSVGVHCAQHAVQALREILSNVVRHSSATEITVDVGIETKWLVLSVYDNGVGFANTAGGGRGLRNLRSRAQDLGGECSIDSAIGRGTLVRWTANRMD